MRTIDWVDGKVEMIDQTKLPHELVIIKCEDYQAVAEAIKTMKVRGAPAIGVAAAFGLALGAQNIKTDDKERFFRQLEEIAQALRTTRPTAVNLFWAIGRMLDKAKANYDCSITDIKDLLIAEAKAMADADVNINRRIGEYGKTLIKDGDTILTHCNTGSLATVDFGTALGVIRAAHEEGKKIQVFADETRPLLQGARLTVWELQQQNIPVTLITDNMAGYFMQQGKVNLVIVGADRIAANGDTANKIGTYSVAVLAKENKIPFYVAAPTSTIDLSIASGAEIVIEERKAEEVTHIGGTCVAPVGIKVANPAFDVTPARYITGIITEKGIATYPFAESFKKLF